SEHVAVEEQQRPEGLVLRARRDVARDRQVGQELLDFRCAHRVRMTDAVEADVSFGPVDITLFGSVSEVPDASGMAGLVEEFHDGPRKVWTPSGALRRGSMVLVAKASPSV